MAPTALTKVSDIIQRVQFDVPEPERQALATDIQTQLAALPTSIQDIDTYRKVVESLPVLKRAEDRVVAFFKDMKSKAFEAHRAITSKESEQLKPITAARTRMGQLKYAFEQEQDRLRRERERVAAEALLQQQQADALEEASALEAQGAPEMAAMVVEQAIAAPLPTIVLPSQTTAVVADVKGVGKSKPRWVWRYLGAESHETAWKDLTPEQRDRIMGLLPREYCQPDESKLGKIVVAMNGNIKIPGVETFDIGSTSVRG